MRTTLTLDDDLAEKLHQLAEQRKEPFKRVLNETLRRGLSAQERPKKQPAFKIQTFASGYQPGVDPLHFNRLLDELEVEDFKRKNRR